jgi:hypothetical protein
MRRLLWRMLIHTTHGSLTRISIEESVSSTEHEQEEHHNMMSEREANESIHEQASPTYGRYEGDREYARQNYDASDAQPLREEPGGKVYPPQGDNKNLFRLILFVIAMVTLLALAVICLLFVGGTGGWISFCAASLAIFIIAAVAIDKIK